MGKSNSKELTESKRISQNQVGASGLSPSGAASFFQEVDESMLEKEPILKTMQTKKKVTALEHLEQQRQSLSKLEFEHDLILAFWFAVHNENVEIARHILNSNIYIRQLVTLALFRKNERQNEEDDFQTEVAKRQIFQARKEYEQTMTMKATIAKPQSNPFSGFRSRREEVKNMKTPLDNQESFGSERQSSRNLNDNNSVSESDNDSDLVQKNNLKSPTRNQRRGNLLSPIRKNVNEMNFEGGSAESGEESDQQSENQSQLDNDQSQEIDKESQSEDNIMQDESQINNEDPESDASEEFIRKRDEEHLQFLKSQGISEFDVETVDLNSKEKVITLKNSLRVRFPLLLTNILKIILYKNEEKLACLLTAYYEIALDDDMIFRGIENGHFQWLMYVWAFNKNYLGPKNMIDASPITFTQLFDIVKNMYETSTQVKEGVKNICKWMLITDDNILLSLLYHYQDNLALEYMGYYNKFIDKDLFLYSMNHGNKMFLQDGCRTNFLLNVLLLIDISLWKNKYLKELIQVFEDYVEQSYETNFLLLSYNPLMSIALTSELLQHIAHNRKRFENECNKIYDDLLELGKMFTSKIQDERYYENLILDVDFRDRSILKIITENYFEPLMPESDPKAENLMIKIWHGREATKCDGNLYGFSNLYHIIGTKGKKTGGKSSFFQLVSNFFEVNFNVDYTFQYRYRAKSIYFFFQKEFLCAFTLLIIFLLVSYDYLSYFRGPSQFLINETSEETGEISTVLTNFDLATSPYDFGGIKFDSDDLTHDQRIAKAVVNLQKYKDWKLYLIIFSCSLLYQFFLKQFFNLLSTKKIAIDKWTIIDTLNAIFNIVSYVIISSSSAETLIDKDKKNDLNYIMIFVLIFTWIRFFIYFLVIRDISKMLLTIYEMLTDTVSFIFIVICYFVIVGSVFTTLYQDINPLKFGGLALSCRTLYDAAMAVYDYTGMNTNELSFSVIQMIHIFFANILLMNFLIAILSYTYEKMQQISVFKYKVNLYRYCERYIIAFENSSIGEIVIHPPPINFLTSFILPLVILKKEHAQKVCKMFSFAIFWMENIVFVFFFLLVEILMIPLVYAKTFLNIVTCSVGLFTIMFHCLTWFLSGFFFSLFLVSRDLYFLLKILSMHYGCRQAMGLADELTEIVIDKEVKLKVYNEVRESVIEMYIDIRKQYGGGDDYDSYILNNNINDLDVLNILEEDEGKFQKEVFVVKQSMIHDEWKKRKARQLDSKKGSKSSPTQSRGFISREVTRKGTGLSKSIVTPKESSATVASIMKIQKNKQLSEFIGNKKEGASAKIIEAIIMQKPKASDDEASDDDDQNEFDMQETEMDQNKLEERLVNEFLSKFVIVSESSTLDHINIVIMLKAIPNQIVDYNIDQNELFNFKIFQDSLVAFQNLDMVNAFEYFDEKNRERVQNVKETLITQKTNLNSVHDIVGHVKNKVQKNEEIFAQINFLSGNMSDKDGAHFTDSQMTLNETEINYINKSKKSQNPDNNQLLMQDQLEQKLRKIQREQGINENGLPEAEEDQEDPNDMDNKKFSGYLSQLKGLNIRKRRQ